MEHLTDRELTDYLEGIVPEPRRQEIEGHLLYCKDCRGELAHIMQILCKEISPQEAFDRDKIQQKWNEKMMEVETPGSKEGHKLPKLTVPIIIILVIAAIVWIVSRF